MDLTPDTVVAGKFRLERPLAQGGMGAVWVAHNQQLDVPIALKFMARSMLGSADFVTRFEREAKAAAQLRHPNVVQIFEHGLHDGQPFIAMELLEGESLSTRLRGHSKLAIADVARILSDVCLALRRAHEKGLVHRDLKPANIFLSRHDELEVVKVLDFGIAKSVSGISADEITKSGAVLGSPHYMSPERARRTKHPVDHRADLWALGVIAFRCLTGRLPFPGDDPIDVLIRVCTEPPPLPSSLAPELDAAVDGFFARALARNPDDRFQSAREFAEALAALSRSEPLPRSGSANQTPATASAPISPLPSPEEASDVAATLALSHPVAQQVVAAAPYARTVNQPFEVIVADTPPGGSQAAMPPVPAGSPASEPTFPGTLTSAGAELGIQIVPNRRRAWLVPVAALAGVVVIGILIGTLLLESTPEGVDDTPSQATQIGTATAGTLPAELPVTTATANLDPPIASVAPITSTTTAPLATGSAAPPLADIDEPALAGPKEATPAAATAKASAIKTGTSGGKASNTAAPVKTGGSGYLGKPKF